MEVYRITAQNFPSAREGGLNHSSNPHGGRWNPPGTQAIYTALNRDEAVQEVFHFAPAAPDARFLRHFTGLVIDISNVSFRGLSTRELSELSRTSVNDWSASQSIGLKWLQANDTCALVVPSRVVLGGHSVILNPNHSDFAAVRITKFENLAIDFASKIDPKYPSYRYVNQQGKLSRGKVDPFVEIEKKPAFDVFISHASKDKRSVARSIANAIRAAGLKPWLDVDEIHWGKSIDGSISEGLRDSRFVLLILSMNFISSVWALKEYRAALSKEIADNRDRILPLLHVNSDEEKAAIFDKLPLLADLRYVRWKRNAKMIVREIGRRL